MLSIAFWRYTGSRRSCDRPPVGASSPSRDPSEGETVYRDPETKAEGSKPRRVTPTCTWSAGLPWTLKKLTHCTALKHTSLLASKPTKAACKETSTRNDFQPKLELFVVQALAHGMTAGRNGVRCRTPLSLLATSTVLGCCLHDKPVCTSTDSGTALISRGK